MKRKQAAGVFIDSIGFSVLATGISLVSLPVALTILAGGLFYLAYKFERL